MDQIEYLTDITCEINDTITSIKPDNYGRRLAIGTSNGMIYIYQSINKTYQKIYEYQAHNGPIFQIDWSHQRYGNMFVTCGFDKKVKLFQEINNIYDLLLEFNEHNNCVICVSFYYNSNEFLFVSGGLDGYIVIYKYQNENRDFEIKKIFAHNFGVNCISFFKCDNYISFVTCGNDNLIKIWKFNNDSKKFENYDTIKDIECITNDVCCRDSQHFASCSEDGSVYYWKKDEGKWNPKEIISNPTPVIKVAFNEEGSALAIIGTDGVHQVYSEKSF
jgi:protein transport protein SEC13